MFRAVLLTIFAILLLTIVYHLIFPFSAIGVVITTEVWFVALISVLVISLAVVLVFILPMLFILLAIALVMVWVIVAVALFPFLLPLLLPLLIIMLFVSYLAGRKQRKPSGC